jgi:hypothetical protein
MMDVLSLCRFGYRVAFLAGIAGGCLSHRCRPSGKWALAVALVPLVVAMAREAVLTVCAWSNITGVSRLFC